MADIGTAIILEAAVAATFSAAAIAIEIPVPSNVRGIRASTAEVHRKQTTTLVKLCMTVDEKEHRETKLRGNIWDANECF